MAIKDIVAAELSVPGSHGLTSYVETGYQGSDLTPYTQGSVEAIAAIDTNLALLKAEVVTRYRQEVPCNEIRKVFTFTAIQSLNSQQRADFDTFVLGLQLSDSSCIDPSSVFRAGIVAMFGDPSPTLTTFDATIKELVSIAEFLGIGGVRGGDVESAMLDLNWIV